MYTANATLSYKQSSPVVTGNDPITGEPIFTENTTVSSMLVSLEKDTTESRLNEMAGKDVTGHFYTGRLVSPKIMPSWYKSGMTLDLTWDNGKTGKFYVYPTMRSRFGLESIFGEQIEGIVLT